MTVALFILGRSTFDVPYAEARVAAALSVLDGLGVATAGPREILYDGAAVAAALNALDPAALSRVLIVQATFCDASAACLIAERLAAPITLWAFPEPRTGGRLRLNAFCGLNLAAHALGLRGRGLASLYADPEAATTPAALAEALAAAAPQAPALRPAQGDDPAAERGLAAIRGARIGRIGQHPDGFDTCAYDDGKLAGLCGAKVEPIALGTLFDAARAADPEAVAALRARLDTTLTGLDETDQAALDKSLRLRIALDGLKAGGTYGGFAIRCWPEMFTEWGGAVCGPVAMMGEARTPCACEADVYGALTCLMLQAIAEAPVFLADVVDMDAASDTGVVWHCGQAPLSMGDPAYQPQAAIHSNRRLPLLFQFPLKPGRVTLARISQALGRTHLVLARGEAVQAPPAFSGTSGTIRFDRPATVVAERLIAAGIEHHMALAYGEHGAALETAAARLGLPVLDLTA
jgi:L-fucose isomerase-like protein